MHELKEAGARQRVVDVPVREQLPEERVALQRREARAGEELLRRLQRPARVPDQLYDELRGRPVAHGGSEPAGHDPPGAAHEERPALVHALGQAHPVRRVQHAAQHGQQEQREPRLQRAEAGAAEAVVGAARPVCAVVAFVADHEGRDDRPDRVDDRKRERGERERGDELRRPGDQRDDRRDLAPREVPGQVRAGQGHDAKEPGERAAQSAERDEDERQGDCDAVEEHASKSATEPEP